MKSVASCGVRYNRRDEKNLKDKINLSTIHSDQPTCANKSHPDTKLMIVPGRSIGLKLAL